MVYCNEIKYVSSPPNTLHYNIIVQLLQLLRLPRPSVDDYNNIIMTHDKLGAARVYKMITFTRIHLRTGG